MVVYRLNARRSWSAAAPLLAVVPALLPSFSQFASACKFPAPVAPFVFERKSDDGSATFVMLESRHGRQFPQAETSEEIRLRAEYPRTGLYLNDNPKTPLWTLDGVFSERQILGLFHSDGHYYMVLQGGNPSAALTFLKDGVVTRTYDHPDWLYRQWVEPIVTCGNLSRSYARWVEYESGPRVIVRSTEGYFFIYDAKTGQLHSSGRSRIARPVTATPYEQSLSERMAGFLVYVDRQDWFALEFELTGWMAPRVAVSCDEVLEIDPLRQNLEPMDIDLGDTRILGLRPTNANLPSYPRILHENEGIFDMYRVPFEHAFEFMCGRADKKTAQTTKEMLESSRAATGLSYELAATIFTADIETPSDRPGAADGEMDKGRAGVAILWVKTSEWRIVALNLFAYPDTADRSNIQSQNP